GGKGDVPERHQEGGPVANHKAEREGERAKGKDAHVGSRLARAMTIQPETVTRRTALNLGAARRPALPIEDVPVAGERPAALDAFWLQAGVARLPERERTVIELAYYEDLSENAIARRLRVPLGSVKSWKRRGLNRLATPLGEESP